MPNINTATAKAQYAPAIAGQLSALASAPSSTTNAPERMICAGTVAGSGWALKFPLLYDSPPTDDGLLAVARSYGASGFGDSIGAAEASLLERMGALLESLNDFSDDELDASAHKLRNSLRKLFCRIS